MQTVKAELAALRAGVNVVAMAAALERYAPLRNLAGQPRGHGQALAAELNALQDRRSNLLARLEPPSHDQPGSNQEPEAGGDGEAANGLMSAAADARADIIRLLGSSDLQAIDDALDR
eukprot:SAG31_NODE_1129_length_9755_cov_2.095070_6_plen_118_part_00